MHIVAKQFNLFQKNVDLKYFNNLNFEKLFLAMP
jgi:hypothetical protein